MSRSPIDRRTVLLVCVASAVVLLVGTAALGAAGVLKSTERGDVEYRQTEEFADGSSVTLGPDESRSFAVESPTDADAYYDAVLRVENGGPLINRLGSATEGIQAFHYHPVTYFLFAPLAPFGYVPFKYLLLAASVLATAGGTALLLRTERAYVDLEVTDRQIAVLSVAACGTGPFLSNFKTGQVAPIMYLCVAVCWWGFRERRRATAGTALAVAAFFKPYAVAPVALGFRLDRARLALGTAAAYAAGTAVGVLAFGQETVLTYAGIIVGELTEEAGGSGLRIATASSFELFAPFGPLGTAVRVLALVPLGYLGLVYLRDPDEGYALPLFSGTLLAIFVIVSEATVLDMPLLFPAVVLLGLHAYAEAEGVWLVGAAFLLLHVHPTTLEVLVGAGPRYVGVIASNQDLIRTLVPALQPGVYGVVGLYWLTFRSAPPLPRPAALVE